MKLRPLALLAGLAVASPAVYGALVEGSLAPGVAIRRTLIALLVATLVAGAFEALVAGYGRDAPQDDGTPFARLRSEARTGVVEGVPVSRRRADGTDPRSPD